MSTFYVDPHSNFRTALLNGMTTTVEKLLSNGYIPPSDFSSLGSALECAIYLKYHTRYLHLFSHLPNLKFAYPSAYHTICVLLLSHNINPNASARLQNQLSVLELAIYNDDVLLVKLLIRYGVNVNHATRDLSPLTIALCRLSSFGLPANKEIVGLLRGACAKESFGFDGWAMSKDDPVFMVVDAKVPDAGIPDNASIINIVF